MEAIINDPLMSGMFAFSFFVIMLVGIGIIYSFGYSDAKAGIGTCLVFIGTLGIVCCDYFCFSDNMYALIISIVAIVVGVGTSICGMKKYDEDL